MKSLAVVPHFQETLQPDVSWIKKHVGPNNGHPAVTQLDVAATTVNTIWPAGEMHSTNPRWKPNNHDDRLLNFLEVLIIDVAKTHPAIAHRDVADWLAKVIR